MITGLVAEPSGVAYQNDDYQVPPPDTNPPPIPIPQTEQEVVQWSEANAIYDQTMPAPVRCNAQPIDVQNVQRVGAEVALRGSDGMPGPGLAAAGHERGISSSPDRRSPSTARASPPSAATAGSTRSTARPISRSTTAPSCPGPSLACEGKWAADVVMAHEYGHLLQGRTGLFAAGIIASKNAGSEEDRADLPPPAGDPGRLLLRHLHPLGVELAQHSAGRRRGDPQLLCRGRG